MCFPEPNRGWRPSKAGLKERKGRLRAPPFGDAGTAGQVSRLEKRAVFARAQQNQTMLVMTGRREGTLAEFTALFAEAGFELEQTVVTRSPFTLPVGAPV
jgi:hypothetical protein